MKKKRSFLLMEVVIALFLVTMGAAYLIRAPALAIRQELKALYDIEERRVWRLHLMELEESLAKKAPELSETKKLETVLLKMQLPYGLGQIEKRYCFFCKRKRKAPDGAMVYHVRIEEKPDRGGRRVRKAVSDGAYEYVVAVS